MVAEQLFLIVSLRRVGSEIHQADQYSEETMTKNGNERIHRFDSAADETPTEAVIRGHASLRDKRPIDLSPLADAIPCNALNALVNTGDKVTVTFTYEGTQTTVHGDGEIVIQEPA